jgi:hypothetical protein
MEVTNLLEFSRRAQLREWFEQHAASDKECWIAMYRVKRPTECGDCLPYIDVVEEALCFGWIDSTLKRLPDGRLAQRLSPRRKRSHWTELNKQRCADLEARGLMTEAGRKALAMARPNRRGREGVGGSIEVVSSIQHIQLFSHLRPRTCADEFYNLAVTAGYPQSIRLTNVSIFQSLTFFLLITSKDQLDTIHIMLSTLKNTKFLANVRKKLYLCSKIKIQNS